MKYQFQEGRDTMPDAISPLIQQYTVDFASNNNFLFVKGIQGDGYGTRYVDISLMNNGQPYTINDEVITPVIRGTKPDTSIIFNECEILDANTIRVEITQQMSAVAGRGNYEISIMSNLENRTLTSFPFFIIISKSSFDVGYVTSSNEFGLLIDKINQVHKIEVDLSDLKAEMRESINECDKATDDCIDATENAIQVTQGCDKATTDCINATITANDTIDVMNTLNDAVSNAEQTRIANENQRIGNEDERIGNEIDRENAEQQRQDTFDTTIENVITATNNANIAADAANTATVNTSKATERANNISNDLENKLTTGYFNGRDGVITTVDINQLVFEVINGHLILTYEVGNTDAHKFLINDNGHLIYTLTA